LGGNFPSQQISVVFSFYSFETQKRQKEVENYLQNFFKERTVEKEGLKKFLELCGAFVAGKHCAFGTFSSLESHSICGTLKEKNSFFFLEQKRDGYCFFVPKKKRQK
jgi:hypothetical protein